jgi:hypothetical protein
MPTYTHNTPTPIDLAINWQVGAIEVIASDRSDTIVTVSPTRPEKTVDRRGAEETTVEFDGQRLVVTGPKPRISVFGPTESVDLKVELPSDSRLTAEIAVGGVRSSGRLGATRIKCSMGPVDLDTVGDLWLRAGHGSVTVGTAHGSVEVTADHGQVHIGTVTGDATFKASHGTVTVGEAGGDVEGKLSYGDLDITRALASVTAKTSYGAVRLHEVSSGSIQAESGFGEVAIGVRAGIPAWLDLSSKDGRVRSELEGDSAPDATAQTVAIRARTNFGDISIIRTEDHE